jgi:hypothetical protein
VAAAGRGQAVREQRRVALTNTKATNGHVIWASDALKRV